MKNGSRYWASSCVTLQNGKKLFVSESEESLKKKMGSKNAFIELNTAGIYPSKIYIRKNDIS
jgi:uncharacterized protein YlzI (FlbEa/FlbD family)